MGLFFLLRDLVIAIADALLSRNRRRYEYVVFVRAPREVVWEMLRARDIEFAGLIPLRVQADAVAGRPDLELVHIRAGDTELTMLTRIADERVGEAILYEVLPDGTDGVLIEGEDDYIGFVLTEQKGGTRLDLVRETNPVRWISRITIPMGLRSGAKRYKRKAEAMAQAARKLEPSKG